MNEIELLMLKDEKVREIIGLLKITESERDRYKNALVKIRDSEVNVAAIAEEALSC